MVQTVEITGIALKVVNAKKWQRNRFFLALCWECQKGDISFARSNISCLNGKLSLKSFHTEPPWISSLGSSHHAASWNCRWIHRTNIQSLLWAHATCYWALSMNRNCRLHCVSFLFHLFPLVPCKYCANPIQQYRRAHMTLHSVNIYPTDLFKCTLWISNFWTIGHPPSQ